MPPSPIDSRNVYGKTLHAARMADEHLMRVELQNRLQAQLTQEKMAQQVHDQVELRQEREPSRGIREDEERDQDKRRKKKQDEDDAAEDQTAAEDEDLSDGLRKRKPEDDAGKGDQLDIKG